MTLQLGILLALVCAFATNLGFFYKHRGACAAPPGRHPPSAALGQGAVPLASGSRSAWLVALGAWVFHVAALALAPMSVVQVVLAGGVVLLAVMADGMFGFEVGRRQWSASGLTAVGLVLLAITLPGAARRALELLARRR